MHRVRSDDDASLILVPLGIKLTLELELLRPALVARFTGPAIMAALVSESDARNSLKVKAVERFAKGRYRFTESFWRRGRSERPVP